jgi:hypothetical protein
MTEPVSSPRSSRKIKVVVPICHSSDVVSTIDSAAGLLVQIIQLLIGHGESTENHRDLRLELTSLCQSLMLAKIALQEYESRPLVQSLANIIHPEAVRCRAVLHDLLNRAKGTLQALDSTIIRGLWRPVWWSLCDGDELASLRVMLTDSRTSLNEVLVTLNSWVSSSRLFCTM